MLKQIVLLVLVLAIIIGYVFPHEGEKHQLNESDMIEIAKNIEKGFPSASMHFYKIFLRYSLNSTNFFLKKGAENEGKGFAFLSLAYLVHSSMSSSIPEYYLKIENMTDAELKNISIELYKDFIKGNYTLKVSGKSEFENKNDTIRAKSFISAYREGYYSIISNCKSLMDEYFQKEDWKNLVYISLVCKNIGERGKHITAEDLKGVESIKKFVEEIKNETIK